MRREIVRVRKRKRSVTGTGERNRQSESKSGGKPTKTSIKKDTCYVTRLDA